MLKEKEITILALHLGYGGIEQYISSLCKMLDDEFKINIITTYKLDNTEAFYFSNKVNITYLIPYGPNKEELKDAINNKQLFKIIKEGFKSLKILYLKRKLNIAAIKKINSKYIITTRDFHNELVGKYANKDIIKIATEHNHHNNNQKYINRLVRSVNNFNYFVLVSNSLALFYQKLVNGPKCVYIPNVIDSLPKKRSSLDSNTLLSIGRLEAVKGFDDLIDIISIIKEKITDIKLYLIGDGSLKKDLETKIKSNNLENNIFFTGFLSKDEISKYMANAKLYVMTSHSESFGLVLIEAMSYGIPCIAFDSAAGAKELLKDDIGLLIENRSKEKMADSIIKLLNNQEKLNKMSEKSIEFVKNYLPENVKNEWLNILK